VLHRLLSAAAGARRRLSTQTGRVVRGIECWTNFVRGGCRVELPWFGQAGEAAVTVVSDRSVDLAFTAGPCAGALAAQGTVQVSRDGEDVRGYQYTGRVPIEDGTLSVALSAGRASWRLLRLSAI